MEVVKWIVAAMTILAAFAVGVCIVWLWWSYKRAQKHQAAIEAIDAEFEQFATQMGAIPMVDPSVNPYEPVDGDPYVAALHRLGGLPIRRAKFVRLSTRDQEFLEHCNIRW